MGWDGRGQTTGQAQLNNKKQPAGDELSADGGKADVTGNPLNKSEQQAAEDYSADGGKALVTGNPLDKRKQPAGDKLSADGGKADVTGNPPNKSEQPSGEDYILRPVDSEKGICNKQPAGKKQATSR
jgi:hypothetical protein